MSKIRIRKCKNNDNYRYRFRRDGTSEDMTQKEIQRFKTLNLIVAPSFNLVDRSIILNEYADKNIVFLN